MLSSHNFEILRLIFCPTLPLFLLTLQQGFGLALKAGSTFALSEIRIRTSRSQHAIATQHLNTGRRDAGACSHLQGGGQQSSRRQLTPTAKASRGMSAAARAPLLATPANLQVWRAQWRVMRATSREYRWKVEGRIDDRGHKEGTNLLLVRV